MAQPSSTYAVARIHALELKLLDRAKIERMIEADSPEDVLKILAESGEYSSSISEIAGAHDYEKMLEAERRKLKELLEKISPRLEITDIFFYKYDIHNLKVLLKAHFLERDYDEFLTATAPTDPALLKKALTDGDYREIAPYLGRAITEALASTEERVDPQRLGVALEREMYAEIIEVCKREKQAECLDYFRAEIDLSNIKSFLRIAKAGLEPSFFGKIYIPGGALEEELFWRGFKEGAEKLPELLATSRYYSLLQDAAGEIKEGKSLSGFEKRMENMILQLIRDKAKNKYNSIEPVIGYIFAKEYEAKIVRMIMVAKLNGLEKDSIRERLRDSYV